MASAREDAETLLRAQELGRPTSRGKGVKEEGRREEKGMYESLSLHHLYTLLDCLLQAHRSLRIKVYELLVNVSVADLQEDSTLAVSSAIYCGSLASLATPSQTC